MIDLSLFNAYKKIVKLNDEQIYGLFQLQKH